MHDRSQKPDNQSEPYWLDHRDRSNLTHYKRFPSWRERRREQTLKDWYGPELGCNEIRARQHPAASLESSLDSLMKELGKGRQVILEQIKDQWPQLAGADIARQTKPLKLYNQCLDIEVSHAMWLYELQTRRKAQLLERLRELAPREINDIRFLPSGRRR